MATQSKEGEFDDLRDELAKIKADIGGLADDLRTLAATAAETAKRTAQAKGEGLRGRLDEELDELLKRGGKTMDDAKARIEERPLLAILVALLIGFVIGRLLDRR